MAARHAQRTGSYPCAVILDRRDFLVRASSGALAAGTVGMLPIGCWRRAEIRPAIGAVAFDAFPIFDPRPIQALAEQLAPGRGAGLVAAWRTRQFEYCWLRTLADRYADFEHVTADALDYAADAAQVRLTAEQRNRLVRAHSELKAWPDALPALRALRAAGIRMAFLSNFTAKMLDACVASAGLGGFFGPHLTTDRVRAFKPDPRAYAMAPQAFGLPREQVAYVAFAGWDAAGAKWAGLPTMRVDRLGAPPERLGAAADHELRGLDELPGLLG